MLAFVLVTSKIGKEKELIRELSRINSVREVSAVYGDYDIIVKVETDSLDTLNKLVMSQIRANEGVSSTSTLIGF